MTKIKHTYTCYSSHSQLSGKKMGPLSDLQIFHEDTVASFLTNRFFHLKALHWVCSIPLINHSLPDLVQLCTPDVQLYISIPFPHFSFSIALIKYLYRALFLRFLPLLAMSCPMQASIFPTTSVAPRTEADTW